MGYRHPSLANNLFPTDIAPINQAIRLSLEPDPMKRDLRPLMALISAMPKAHPDLLADMVTMRNWITGWEWDIKPHIPEGESSPPEIEVQRARAIRTRFREAGLHNAIDTLANGRFIGIALLELLWGVNTRGENAVLIWQPVDAVEIAPLPTAATRLCRLVYPSFDSDQFTRMPYDTPASVIIARFNPLSGIDGNHWGGLLYSVLWYSWLQYVAWYYWMRSGERLGIISTPRNFQNNAAASEAWSWLQQVVDHALMVPEELKVMIKDVLGNPPGHELFEKFIAAVDATRQRLIFGQSVVNSQTATGSYAKAKEAQTSTYDNKWSYLRWLCDIITDQYVRTDYLLNYGAPAPGVEVPRFVFETDEAEDYKTNAQILSQLSSAGFEATDADEVSRKTGFKVQKSATPGGPIP